MRTCSENLASLATVVQRAQHRLGAAGAATREENECARPILGSGAEELRKCDLRADT